MPRIKPFSKSSENLSEMAGRMYQILAKIASSELVWTLKEVRDLLSEIDGTERA